VAVAVVASPSDAADALDQAWEPFVLVAGLLLIGDAAQRDGVFAAAGARLERLPAGGGGLLIACLALVAVTTALLNLDTAAVFLTPALVHVAWRRGLAEAAFLYGSVMMVNAASLFLPGSNLTNLLVLEREDVAGSVFAARMFPAAITATVVTAAGVWLLHSRELRGAGAPSEDPVPLWRRGPALPAAAAAAVVMLTVQPAAPFVAALGLAVAAAEVAARRASWRTALGSLDPAVLLGLLLVAVALGTLPRGWSGPARLVNDAGRFETAAIAAIAAVLVNNLPAAVLMSAGPIPHPRALLVGLAIGPNLFVTGSLSAYLWWQAARGAGAQPTIRGFVRHGLILAPAAIVAALTVAAAVSSHR
jgi:arsenical pump membrane protein